MCPAFTGRVCQYLRHTGRNVPTIPPMNVWQNGAHCVGFNEHSRAGVVLFNTEWRFMLCFARAGAWKKTLLGVFLLFAGALALANVPQLPDWTKEKVPARVENVLGGSFLSVDPVLTDANTGASFNRYVYANNNPYRYIDPDGRQARDIERHCEGNCTRIGGAAARNDAIATGAKIGAGAGVVVALICDAGTGGVCVLGNPTILATGTLIGGIGGAIVNDLKERFGGANDRTSDGSPPPDDDDKKKQLSNEDKKSIKSLEKRIDEHKQKLADFKKNPSVRPGMENQSEATIQAQRSARIRHLETEIRTFQNNINKINGGF